MFELVLIGNCLEHGESNVQSESSMRCRQLLEMHSHLKRKTAQWQVTSKGSPDSELIHISSLLKWNFQYWIGSVKLCPWWSLTYQNQTTDWKFPIHIFLYFTCNSLSHMIDSYIIISILKLVILMQIYFLWYNVAITHYIK